MVAQMKRQGRGIPDRHSGDWQSCSPDGLAYEGFAQTGILILVKEEPALESTRKGKVEDEDIRTHC